MCFPVSVLFLLWMGVSPAMTQTYNSFIRQTGYCKLQHFETISRSSSNGAASYQRGDVMYYVGLNQFYFNHTQRSCGICLNVTAYENLYDFNFEINERQGLRPPHQSFIVMVADECNDAICQQNFLDIDIYTEKQAPFFHSLRWYEIPCPLDPSDRVEYLICFSTTCNGMEYSSLQTVKEVYDPYYFSMVIKNHIYGIDRVRLHFPDQTITLRDGQGAGWTNDVYLELSQWINVSIDILDKHGHLFKDVIELLPDGKLDERYHGGYLIQSQKSWLLS